MYRTISEELEKWRVSLQRKPLVLQGVRQCGKTYTIRQFGEEKFKHTAYFNFERNRNLAQIFEYDYDTSRILNELALSLGHNKIDLSDTLIIFDEIQECPKAVTSLKYFCEELPEMYLVAAGSLLGPAIRHNSISFPVGKVTFLSMYPMSFYEFALANGMQRELKLLQGYALDRKLSDELATRFRQLCKQYYVVGGMPEAVKAWTEKKDYELVEKTQRDILISYENDFGKYLDPSEALKVGWIWQSIPVQLAKENNKFMFSHVKEGKRSADLEDALEWLNKAELIFNCCLVRNPELPLSFFADATYFKVYTSDVGLLRVRCGLSAKTILEETPYYATFKGALTENYVMNELVKAGYKPYFWRSDSSAEVDFLIEANEKVIPIDTKAETNTKAKSYRVYCKRYSPRLGLRLSMNNVGENMIESTQSYSLPLYMLWKLPQYLG